MGAFEELWEGSDQDSILCSADPWEVGLEARSLIRRLWRGPPTQENSPYLLIQFQSPPQPGSTPWAPAFPGTPTSELLVSTQRLSPSTRCGRHSLRPGSWADKDRWGWDPLGPGCPGADSLLNASVALSHCLLSLCDLITEMSFRLTQTVCFASTMISNFLRSQASARWNVVTPLFPAT